MKDTQPRAKTTVFISFVKRFTTGSSAISSTVPWHLEISQYSGPRRPCRRGQLSICLTLSGMSTGQASATSREWERLEGMSPQLENLLLMEREQGKGSSTSSHQGKRSSTSSHQDRWSVVAFSFSHFLSCHLGYPGSEESCQMDSIWKLRKDLYSWD